MFLMFKNVSRTHDVWHVRILFYFKEHCFLYLFVPFRLLILSMLFFHLLVTFFSPNQIFQQKRLLPNQAFVISLCNLILFLAVHFSLLKLLIYKFLFVKTLHIKMTKKLNVNQPLCMQLFCRYMHVNAAIPLVCTVELRIFFRVLFFTYTILFVNKF